MAKWKRSKAIYLVLEDESVFRLQDLLSGRVEPVSRGRLCAFDLVQGRRLPIDENQVAALASLPADCWVESSEFEPSLSMEDAQVEALVEAGCLLTDGDSPQEVRARELDQALESYLWHPDALFFHRIARLHADPESGEFPALDIGDVVARSSSRAKDFVELHGEPPPVAVSLPIHKAPPVALPEAEEDSELASLLRNRRTVRAFDAERPLPVSQFCTLLKLTFGKLGQVELTPGLQLLKKGSPSGGGLHPIEAFPLVRNVEGLAPGLYHYDAIQHQLWPVMGPSTEAEAREAMQRMGARQLYMGEAHFLVLLVARFHRNQWKYRRQSRTYSVMLMDAGHLSQTFYLLATQLGLGAFFSGAIDVSAIEEMLSLPPEAYGPLGVCGCGLISQDGGIPFEGGLPLRVGAAKGED